MPQRDPFAELGVPRTASQRQISAAFRSLARAYHPDLNRHDPDAERRFKRIARAYRLIGNRRSRAAYERGRDLGRFGGPGAGGSYAVETGGLYHSDLGHHSDFYQAGDPLSTVEAARLVNRSAGWLRRAIREGRLPASRGPRGYLLRRRDVERLDRSARRRTAPSGTDDQAGTA